MAVNLDKLVGRQIVVRNTNGLLVPPFGTILPDAGLVTDITVDATDKEAGLIQGHFNGKTLVVNYSPLAIIELVGANQLILDP